MAEERGHRAAARRPQREAAQPEAAQVWRVHECQQYQLEHLFAPAERPAVEVDRSRARALRERMHERARRARVGGNQPVTAQVAQGDERGGGLLGWTKRREWVVRVHDERGVGCRPGEVSPLESSAARRDKCLRRQQQPQREYQSLGFLPKCRLEPVTPPRAVAAQLPQLYREARRLARHRRKHAHHAPQVKHHRPCWQLHASNPDACNLGGRVLPRR